MDNHSVMKKILTIFLSLSCVLYTVNSFACTNLIVGRKASVDGSVIVSYNADSYCMYGNMYRHVGGVHVKGEMRKVYEWDTNRYLGEIPQCERTYNVVGQMNENQVTVTETTFGGREELCDSTGILDYGSLIYIALERSRTAREAIKVMTDLVAQYGYYSEGETFTIADKNEAWIMEMVGKGPGSKGAVWVAVRIPDDCICAHANQSRITRFNMKDKANVMYSKDVIKFARLKGYFSGKDSDFSFRDAYNPLDFSGIRYCEARVWSFFNKYGSVDMNSYLPFINGEDLKGEMPLFMKPRNLMSAQDIKNGMRDHYEGTPLDITEDLGAGAYRMPYRPSPLSFKVDGKEYFNERPISTQQTGFTFVGQMRSWLPDAFGGIVWWGNDDANMVSYTPVYCGTDSIPKCFTRIDGVQDDVTFSWESAFWLQNAVSNMVYPYYSKIYPDLRIAIDGIDSLFISQVRDCDARFGSMSADELHNEVTKQSLSNAKFMMDSWTELYKYLFVKHNDMVVKVVGEDGKLKRTKYGYAESPVRPGYPEDFSRRIVKETGKRYEMK